MKREEGRKTHARIIRRTLTRNERRGWVGALKLAQQKPLRASSRPAPSNGGLTRTITSKLTTSIQSKGFFVPQVNEISITSPPGLLVWFVAVVSRANLPARAPVSRRSGDKVGAGWWPGTRTRGKKARWGEKDSCDMRHSLIKILGMAIGVAFKTVRTNN
jgi:hypothetical protein